MKRLDVLRPAAVLAMAVAAVGLSAAGADAAFLNGTFGFDTRGTVTYGPNNKAGLNKATSITIPNDHSVNTLPDEYADGPNQFLTLGLLGMGDGVSISQTTLPIGPVSGGAPAAGVFAVTFGGPAHNRFVFTLTDGSYTATPNGKFLGFEGTGTLVDTQPGGYQTDTGATLSFAVTQDNPRLGSAVNVSYTLSTTPQPGAEAVVPEPASAALLGTGVVGLLGSARRRRATAG